MSYTASVSLSTGQNPDSKGKVFVKVSLNQVGPGEDEEGNPADVVIASRNFALTGIPGTGDMRLPDADAVRAFGQSMIRFADRIAAGKVAAIPATGPVPAAPGKNGATAQAVQAAPAATLPTL